MNSLRARYTSQRLLSSVIAKCVTHSASASRLAPYLTTTRKPFAINTTPLKVSAEIRSHNKATLVTRSAVAMETPTTVDLVGNPLITVITAS